SAQIDLDGSTVTQEAKGNSLISRIHLANGTQWELRWSAEQGNGDLLLQTSARCAKPVDEMRILFFGCDIAHHTLVWVDVNGVGRPIHAPWNDSTIGDPQGAGSPMGYMHPLVALFQGDSSGFFIEGREPRIGPACVMMRGTGQ